MQQNTTNHSTNSERITKHKRPVFQPTLTPIKRSTTNNNYMKTNKHLLTLAVGAAAALAASSCQDYVVFDEGQIKVAELNEKYDDAFAKKFGTPDPNQDWGMNEEIGAIGGLKLSTPLTRANFNGDESTVSKVWTNRNMWGQFKDWDPNNKKDTTIVGGTKSATIKVPIYDKDALGHDIIIPGWPHLNGLYYGSNGAGALEHTWTGEQLPTSGQPVGDVTPFEIQYVSTWFRTHRITNPENFRENLHLSDFFVQNISCDNDQVIYEHAVDASTSMAPVMVGGKYCYSNGDNITNGTQNTPYNTITHTNNSTESVDFFLDALGFQDVDGKWTHVNNYNRSNSNFDPENKNDNPNREIKYITSAGTENFHCHPSWNTDKETEWIDNWVLIHLTWTEEVVNTSSPLFGEKIPREGYYLAFDFKAGKDNVKVVGDGFYSNWIIKITPGNFNPSGNTRRIFCEDLGGTLDFDFNDAVVDVAFDEISNGQFQSIISVQATGATMPIYVENDKTVKNGFYEIHNLLDNASGEMKQINVLEGTFSNHAPAVYRGNIYSSPNVSDIKLIVYNTRVKSGDPQRYELTGGTNQRVNLDDPTNNPYKEGGTVAPRAFATPTSVKWMKEYECIDDGYRNFINWVNDKAWYATSPKPETYWYDLPYLPERYLYTPVVAQEGSPVVTPTLPSTWIDLALPEIKNQDATSTMYSQTKADGALMLRAYDGDDAIWRQILSSNLPNSHQITFTAVFTSDTKYDQSSTKDNATNLQAILVPANLDTSNGQLSYQGTNFGIANLSKFQTSAFHESSHEFCADNTNHEHATHTYTYTATFSFTVGQLRSNASQPASESNFCNWLLLYFRLANEDNEPIDNFAIGQGKGSNGINIRKWYVHY